MDSSLTALDKITEAREIFTHKIYLHFSKTIVLQQFYLGRYSTKNNTNARWELYTRNNES